MSAPDTWQRLISVLVKKLDQSASGVQIRRFSTAISRLYLGCGQAAGMASADFPDHISDKLESLLDTSIEARKAHERGDLDGERQHVETMLKLYREVLGNIDVEGMQEPTTLTVTFNNLVRRHRELNPDQAREL